MPGMLRLAAHPDSAYFSVLSVLKKVLYKSYCDKKVKTLLCNNANIKKASCGNSSIF